MRQTNSIELNPPQKWRSGLVGAVIVSLLSGGTAAAAIAQTPPNQVTSSRQVAQTSSESATDYPTLQIGSTGEQVSELQAMLTLLSFYDGDVDGVYSESTQAAVIQFQTAAGLEGTGIVGPETWEKLLPTPGSVADAPVMPMEEPTLASANADEGSEGSSPNEVDSASGELPDLDETASTSPVSDPMPAPAGESSGEPPEDLAVSQAPEEAAEPEPAAEAPEPEAEEPSPEPAAAAESPSESTEISLPILKKGMQGSAVSQLQSRLQTLGFYGGEIDGAFGEQTEVAVQNLQREHELGVDGIVGPATWAVLLR